jgi:hypothetical protein
MIWLGLGSGPEKRTSWSLTLVEAHAVKSVNAIKLIDVATFLKDKLFCI